MLIIANSMVDHPLESLPVPLPQNTMSTCIILQTGGGVWAFRCIVVLATQILREHGPPNKRMWGCINSTFAYLTSHTAFKGVQHNFFNMPQTYH